MVQRSVHYLRSFRPFSIETPMQYIFIHRVVRAFTQTFVRLPKGFTEDYERWMVDRSQRLFVDDYGARVSLFQQNHLICLIFRFQLIVCCHRESIQTCCHKSEAMNARTLAEKFIRMLENCLFCWRSPKSTSEWCSQRNIHVESATDLILT